MAMEAGHDVESFITAVKEGLKLMDGGGGGGEIPASLLLPTAPVVYAAVPNDSGKTALVPLQIGFVSARVTATTNAALDDVVSSSSSSSLDVRIRTSWILETRHSNAPLTLAVPVGPQGTLVSYEVVKHSKFSPSALQKVNFEDNHQPHLPNLYLLPLPRVEVPKWTEEIFVLVNYVQGFKMIDYEQGLYSFSVPLSIPSYVALKPWRLMQTQKIRIILECRGVGAIKDCDIPSHSMIDLITDERRQVYVQESRDYSDKDLACSFRVTSPTMFQTRLLHQEMLFVTSVEEGLTLISQEFSSSPQSVLPTAPMLYAVVSNLDIMDINATAGNKAFQLPALVPLPMTSLSVKINAEPKPDSMRANFKGSWCVQYIKKGNTCPLILAIPVGYGGYLLRYEICVSTQSPKVLKSEEFTASNRPQFQNVYLVALPPCEGGADIFIRFCYAQDVIQKQGLFSFTVPLSVPSYVGKVAHISSKERIRLTLECKDTGTITKCDVPSHHLMELMSSDKLRVLLKESVEYSGKDLTCSFMVTW